MGYSPQGHKELDTTEQLTLKLFKLSSLRYGKILENIFKVSMSFYTIISSEKELSLHKKYILFLKITVSN